LITLLKSSTEINTMSESGNQLFNDLTNTPESSHQAPDKERRSGRVRIIPMSEFEDQHFNDLTNTPESSHQAPSKKRRSGRVRTPMSPNRRSGRVRTPMSPYSPTAEKGAKKAKRKSKENLSKMVNDKVKATMKQYMAAAGEAEGFLESSAPRKEAWVIPPIRDSILGMQMKLLSQIQAAQQNEEEQQESRQHQGEEEALSTVKVEGGEEIALMESVIEDDEEPLSVAFRKEKELYQKIKTAAMVVQNLGVQKARAEQRKQAYIEEWSALKRKMEEMMEAKAKDIRRSFDFETPN